MLCTNTIEVNKYEFIIDNYVLVGSATPDEHIGLNHLQEMTIGAGGADDLVLWICPPWEGI